jgi:hypothetical protein
VRGAIRSTIVIVATIITVGNSRGMGVADAAARANPEQTKAATSTPGDACSLLTKLDAAAALGEPVSGPKSSSPGRSAVSATTPSSCEYSGSGLHKVNLNLMHLSPDTAVMYRAFCTEKGKEGLSGLGDVACWYSQKHEELQVLKGVTFFSIELRRSGDPTEAIKGVAKKVFDRLR